MPFDSYTLHLFSLTAIAVLVVNIFLLGAVLLFGAMLFKRLFVYHEEIDRHERGTMESARKILHEAEAEAILILKEAHKKANDLLGHTESLKRKSEEGLEIALQHLSRVHAEELVRASRGFSGNLDSVLKETKLKISEDAKKILSLFENQIISETDKFRAGLQEMVKKSHEMAEGQISRYKEDSMKEVDEKIYQIISDISREVVGEALELEGQKGLLIKLLDRAKKDFLKK